MAILALPDNGPQLRETPPPGQRARYLSQTATRLEAHISDAGRLDLGELSTQDAVVSISGAGDATLDPKVSADISISGAGHVKLKTKPASLQTHISGFGSVEQP